MYQKVIVIPCNHAIETEFEGQVHRSHIRNNINQFTSMYHLIFYVQNLK